MKYIAYGSNMSQEQMAFRCPDAELIGIGYVTGYTLEFFLHATIVPSANKSSRVPVAVWEISEEDEAMLDRYEGVPDYYSKQTVTAEMLDGSRITGLVYIMELQRLGRPVSAAYYDGIRDAYRDLGFGSEIQKILGQARRKDTMRQQKFRYARRQHEMDTSNRYAFRY